MKKDGGVDFQKREPAGLVQKGAKPGGTSPGGVVCLKKKNVIIRSRTWGVSRVRRQEGKNGKGADGNHGLFVPQKASEKRGHLQPGKETWR